jgi:lysophospholipase L1-like esterase
VARFVANIDEARKLALERRIPVLFCLQPFILQKRRKTEIEERLLELTWAGSLTRDFLERSHAELRRSMLKVCAAEGAQCADLSGIFDDQRQTTFTDAWHFTDPGHRILATALQARIAPLLISVRTTKP